MSIPIHPRIAGHMADIRRAAVTAEDIQNARTVITHPEIFASDAATRLTAWHVLVTASGSAFYRDRVQRRRACNSEIERGTA